MPAFREPPAGDGEWGELAVGYALDALEPADVAVFERHVSGCSDCAALVEELRATAAALAATVAEPPPVGLRAAILDNLDERPRDAVLHQVRSVGGRGRHIRAAGRVAAAVAVIAAITWNVSLQGQVDSARNQVAQASELLECGTSPDCRTVWLRSPDDGASAAVLVRPGTVQLVVHGLPPDDVDRETYVLWQRDDQGRMRPLRAFDVRSTQLQAIGLGAPLTTDVTAGDFAVSREPGRGLPDAPTHPVLLPV